MTCTAAHLGEGLWLGYHFEGGLAGSLAGTALKAFRS